MNLVRRFTLASVLLALLLLVHSPSPALHAQSAPAFSPDASLLRGYRLTGFNIPGGFTLLLDVENTDIGVANPQADPATLAKIVQRQRIDGWEEDFRGPAGTNGRVQVFINIFSDSSGAQAELQDPVELAGDTLTPASAPQLGDMSAGFQFAGSGPAPQSGLAAGFTLDRVEVEVEESIPNGTASLADLTSFLQPIAAAVAAAPPPPPSGAELALLQTETQPETVLHDAYNLLMGFFAPAPDPATILSAAYTGALNALSAAGATNLPAAPVITTTDPEQAFQQFLPAYQQLESLAGSVSTRDLAYAAGKAMYSNLNCHTQFFTPTNYSREIASLSNGPFAGIGILRSPHAPYIILRVYPNTPAQQAGLMPGDQILAVDGTPASQVSENDFNTLFQGAVGDPITLTIQRPGTSAPFDVMMTRQLINLPTESHKILPGGIGYIEFNSFIQNSSEAVSLIKGAISDFQAAGGVNSWILDLRSNGGGSAATMERVAGLFLPSGTNLATQVTQDGTSLPLRASGTPLSAQPPLVILTGPGTASAAEIFTQALHDLGRAEVVGSKTAGCVNGGLIFGLLDTSGVFVSVGQVFVGPNNVTLENVGITPDINVPLSVADIVAGRDPQLDAAVNYLMQQTSGQ